MHQVDGLLRAGLAHFYFVTIHPFEDGNGRIARALTDMALAQDEKAPTRFYSLSSQIMKERNRYYEILERCQKGGCWHYKSRNSFSRNLRSFRERSDCTKSR
ncbi:MAG: Fic family protein [Chlamydiae bacterium]|nr:Fic family protein [Chlamydiota bacterium]